MTSPEAPLFGLRIHSGMLAAAVLCVMGQLFFQTARFVTLFSHPEKSFLSLAYAFLTGQVCNVFVPGRLGGEALKVWLARLSHQVVPLTRGAALLGLDKIADIASLGLLLIVFGPREFPRSPPVSHTVILVGHWMEGVYGYGLGCFTCVLVLAIVWVRARFAVAFLCAAGAWIAEAKALAFLAAPHAPALTLSQALLTLALLNIGLIIPMGLAHLGIYEATLTLGLTSFSFALSEALRIALFHHMVQIAALVLQWSLCGLLQCRLRNRQRLPEPILTPFAERRGADSLA